MKIHHSLILFALSSVIPLHAGGGKLAPDLKTNPEAIKEFQDWRFGMFIHWGPVSLKGTEIGWSRGKQVPLKEYDTPEQHIGAFNMLPWETCMTICHQWAWKPSDKMKSAKQCIQSLIKTNGGNGNFLFNVGPMPDGRIEPRQVERLKKMGAWLKEYGDSLYGTRGGPFLPNGNVFSTRKGNTIYLHFLNNSSSITLPISKSWIKESKVLTGGSMKVDSSKDQSTTTITLSKESVQEIDAIVDILAINPINPN